MPESANLCHVWPVCECRGMAVSSPLSTYGNFNADVRVQLRHAEFFRRFLNTINQNDIAVR